MKPTRRIILLLLFMLLTSPTVIAQSDNGQGLPTEDKTGTEKQDDNTDSQTPERSATTDNVTETSK